MDQKLKTAAAKATVKAAQAPVQAAQATVQAKAQFLFQTPVVIAQVEAAKELTAALKKVILAKKAEDEGIQRSNEGGWHSEADMLAWGGPAARRLAESTKALARKMSLFTDGTADEYDWHVSMWANVSGPGALNHSHIHGGQLWAAVFYVEMGRTAGDSPQGGELYLEDPRFPLVAMKSATFRMIGPDGKAQQSQIQLSPTAGDLVMFPAWLRHGVRTYKGEGERISIAMNLDVTERAAAITRARRDAAEGAKAAKATKATAID